jgi:hypothetical protein
MAFAQSNAITDGGTAERRGNATANITLLSRRNDRSTTEGQGVWQQTVLHEVCGILDLKDGWDTYSAKRVSPQTGIFALQVLDAVMRDRSPIPSVVPTPIGGIQFEWHLENLDIEIHVEEPYSIDVLFEDRRDDEIREFSISSDLRQIYEIIGILTSR